ncbi:Hypothetical predicted protein [Olea europaea subsp. europaea]|uniref:Uncharacterized protein n=1 Tax=Olea europaea subsp. europaea TaxID=158383 RepID=A0A8S0RQ82_OLEEU|nr:Hypothetical predicted protein [Olea europaea subsp. europaea]
MALEPGNFFEHVQILFKFRINEKGKLLLIAEGIKEKNIDIILRLRVRDQRSDVAVIPEAIVNSSKRSSLRVENGLHQDNDTDAFIQSKAAASPESLFVFVKNVPGRAEAQSIANGIRKTTTTYTPLYRSKHDTFETKMSNSSQMKPSREREMAIQIFITPAAAATTTNTTTITTSGSLQSMGNMNMNNRLTLPMFQTRTPPTTSF